ncbi:hypothetical protein AB0E59_19325 [Lentzea sp. NPDC034063]|uniref:hypothetical protein n=1 Tax=unclassified Lentzea TaxID=2643253 RepID=UPI0033DC55CB
MTIKRSRPVAVVQVAPSLSKITLTVTKLADRAPVFRCAANLVPIFQTSRSNTIDQLPGRLQAVGRLERTKTSENRRDCSRW